MNDSTPRIILSVHLPRTAGTTLLHVLRRALGQEAVATDYSEDPSDPCCPRNLDPEGYFAKVSMLPTGFKAIHGHFHIGKYAHTPHAFRMTFLRHPVDTLLSIHAYWNTLGPGRHPLHDYFLKHQLDVFQTARLPLLRHLLTRNYFEGVDMRSFDFIGRHDAFAEDIQRLSAILGLPLVADMHLNASRKLGEASGIAADPEVRARLSGILTDDVMFYETVTRSHAGPSS